MKAFLLFGPKWVWFCQRSQTKIDMSFLKNLINSVGRLNPEHLKSTPTESDKTIKLDYQEIAAQ